MSNFQNIMPIWNTAVQTPLAGLAELSLQGADFGFGPDLRRQMMEAVDGGAPLELTRAHEALLRDIRRRVGGQPSALAVPRVFSTVPRKRADCLRIANVSDLHHSAVNADFFLAALDGIRAADPDILIVGGDVANGLSYFKEAIAMLREGAWLTFVLPGNHDLWSAKLDYEEEGRLDRPDSERLLQETLPRVVSESGAIWLEGASVVFPEFRFGLFGTIVWYDYTGEVLGRSFDEIAEHKEDKIVDGIRMDWRWADPEFTMTRRYLAQTHLEALSERGDVERIHVTTHVPPFLEMQSPTLREKPYFQEGTPYYFAPSFGEVLTGFPKVRAVRSGHSHSGHRTVIPRAGMPAIDAAVIDNLDRNEVLVTEYGR